MAKKKPSKKSDQPELELPLDEVTPSVDEASVESDVTEALAAPMEKVQSGDAPLSQHYKKWFLEYASYVILDRAVPHLDDGLKPVQRRLDRGAQPDRPGAANQDPERRGCTLHTADTVRQLLRGIKARVKHGKELSHSIIQLGCKCSLQRIVQLQASALQVRASCNGEDVGKGLHGGGRLVGREEGVKHRALVCHLVSRNFVQVVCAANQPGSYLPLTAGGAGRD